MTPPRYLYKYHPLNVHLIELLVNSQFYLADQEQLNDPLDAGFTMSYETYARLYYERYPTSKNEEDEKKLKFLFDFRIEQGDRKFLHELSDLPDGLRTTCFTEDGNNPLMWSHYGANHTGVCLKFDLEKDAGLRQAMKPVQYLEQLVEVKERSDFEKSLLTKLNPWSVEKEWRILEKENYFSFQQEALIEIVLGLKVAPSTFSWLDRLSENVYYKAAIHQLVVRGNRMMKLDQIQEIVDEHYVPVPRKPSDWEMDIGQL